MEFSKLKRLPINGIWNNEAHAFTPWLAENLDAIGDALGLDLELVQREAAVGGYSLDLLAQDANTGENVVIENMFGATDHNHVGKLITYAAGFDASTAILVAESFRPEHVAAMEYLNERFGEDTSVFGVTVEVLQIGDGPIAFNVKVVVSPNEWARQTKANTGTNKNITQRGQSYVRFYEALLADLREINFTNAAKVMPQNWYAFSAGMVGAKLLVNFYKDGTCGVGVSISRSDIENNKARFDQLAERRKEIESELGYSLEWERMDDNKVSRIMRYTEGSIDDTPEKLAELRSRVVKTLVELQRVFAPKLQQLKV